MAKKDIPENAKKLLEEILEDEIKEKEKNFFEELYITTETKRFKKFGHK